MFGVEGLSVGLPVSGLGFTVQGLGFRVRDLEGVGFKV